MDHLDTDILPQESEEAIKKAKKKKKLRTQGLAGEKYLGQEPTWTKEEWNSTENKQSLLISAFNWYNYYYGKSESKQFIFDWLEDDKSKQAILNVPDSEIKQTLGWIARLLVRGIYLPQDISSRLQSDIQRLVKESTKAKIELEKQSSKPTITIQDRVEAKSRFYCSKIDALVDAFMDNRFSESEPFSLHTMLSTASVPPVVAKDVLSTITKTLDELRLAKSGKDEQLKEAYQFIKKAQMVRFIEFMERLSSEAEKYLGTAKQVRRASSKPRISKKPRKRDPQKVLSKVKYMKEFPEMGLKSEIPTKIIGADQVWVYNTKTRILGSYISSGSNGLDLKGTTIKGFDEKTSMVKKLRKPESVLPIVMESGKVGLRKILPELSTKPIKPNGRINEDMVILRVI